MDFQKITATEKRISFSKPGMAITLNGIAQGHATDEVRKLLKLAGVKSALINIGEYAALGSSPDGEPWPVRIRTKTGAEIPRTLAADMALAVSAGYGHTFDPAGRYHHIFRPTSGDNPKPESTIIVTAPTATEADVLATTLAVADSAEKATILRSFPVPFRRADAVADRSHSAPGGAVLRHRRVAAPDFPRIDRGEPRSKMAS